MVRDDRSHLVRGSLRVIDFEVVGVEEIFRRIQLVAFVSRQEASLFFRMISYRYQKGSTLITTNKAIKDWPEVLAGDEAMAAATLDRLLHRSHVFNVKGRSYRLRNLEQLLK